ncbi:MAG: proton-conducting transporter membrane subunit [Gemmatimonadota bacterium]|nr:proton-conducting transporter membrane subunit [Gemmatimonadota bacterium]
MSAEILMLLALAVPMLGAFGIAFTGDYPNLRETVTLVTSGVLLLIVGSLVPELLGGGRPQVTLIEMVPGISLMLEVEPLGMIFAGVAALLWPINSLYSIGYMRGNHEKKQTRFYVCFAVAIGSAMGVAFAGNLVTLFVFYEMLTLSTYPLVTHKGTESSMKAGRVYLGILISTSIGLFLLGILLTHALTGSVDFEQGGILEGHVEGPLVGLLLALFMFGIGKAAIMPVHRWLPAAMVAPTPVSALLHAVAVVKAGVFSVVKIVVYVFGIDFLAGQGGTGWLVYASGFTVLAASIVALRILMQQGNLKRMLAYSTVSQLSYVVLAAALFAPMAAAGAALHIVAHAFGKITLFFAAGSIHTAAHKDDIRQLRGVGRRMPWTMGAFTIGALSMIGLPPAGGFISKWYMMLGAFQAEHMVAVGILVASTLLNGAYFVPIIYMAFFQREEAAEPAYVGGGDDHHVDHDHGEAPLPIVIALTATAALTVLLFLFPGVPLALAQALVGGAP